MQDTQFVFVTEDARVMVKLSDGRVEDITETSELLPRHAQKLSPAEVLERKRAMLLHPAA